MIHFDSRGENRPQLGSDRGELHELAVIDRVVCLDVAQIDDRRAERRQFGAVRRVADPVLSPGNETRNPQRLVVAGKDDIARVLDLPKTAQLRFENVEVEMGRRQQDHADLGLVLDVAGQFHLLKRLDGHPVSHGMGEDVDLLGVAGQQHAAA